MKPKTPTHQLNQDLLETCQDLIKLIIKPKSYNNVEFQIVFEKAIRVVKKAELRKSMKVLE